MRPARAVINKIEPVDRAQTVRALVTPGWSLDVRCFFARKKVSSFSDIEVRHLRARDLVEEVLASIIDEVCGRCDVVTGAAETVLSSWCASGHFDAGLERLQGGLCRCITGEHADSVGDVVEASNGSGGDHALDVGAGTGACVVLESNP